MRWVNADTINQDILEKYQGIIDEDTEMMSMIDANKLLSSVLSLELFPVFAATEFLFSIELFFLSFSKLFVPLLIRWFSLLFFTSSLTLFYQL